MMASAETFTVYQESLPSAKILFCEADVRSVLVQEASTARPAQNNIMRTMLDSKAPEATSTDTLDPTTSSDEGNETPASSQFACPKCATPVQLSVSVSFEQKQAKSKSKATSSRNGDQIDSEDAATPNETVNGDSGEKKNETGDGLKNTEEDLQSTAQKRVGLILTKGTDPPKLVNESEWEKSGQIASDVSGGTPPAIVLKRKRALFSLGDDDRKDDELTILSPGLQQVFKEVVKYYPGIAGDGEKTTLKYPYEPLYFYFDEICAAAESDPNVDAKDLEALVDNYNQWIRPDHDKIRRMIADGNIRYNCLWALFRPGDVVFTWDPTGQARLYILIAIAYRDPLPYVSYDIDPNANVRFKRLVADLWSMGWDCVNQEFQRFTTSRSIKSFTGQCPITSLPFYPLSYYANGNAEEIKGLCQSLQESGQRWRSLVSQPPICQHYTGPARDIASPEVQLIDERVIIDETANAADESSIRHTHAMLSYRHEKQRFMPSMMSGTVGTRHDDWQEVPTVAVINNDQYSPWDDLDPSHEFGDLQAQLCPPSIRCYTTKSKRWFNIEVSKVKDAMWAKEALDHLVLADSTKSMLLGLVERHKKNMESVLSDVIPSKGRGLTVVLHGPPGVGKTLTGETIAEYAQKPLLPINIGELTAEADMVIRLRKIFDMAARWDAVLLLDEADVLLEKRSFEDLRRNGIVSIFLRMLEYFDGILFLTTNRIETMDIAFQSRIHIAIKYPALTPDFRRQIWAKFIDRLDKKEAEAKRELKDHLEDLQEWELNGRQIRNVLSIAESIALNKERRRGALRYRHVEEVANATLDFQHFFDDSLKERKGQIGEISGRQFQERRSNTFRVR